MKYVFSSKIVKITATFLVNYAVLFNLLVYSYFLTKWMFSMVQKNGQQARRVSGCSRAVAPHVCAEGGRRCYANVPLFGRNLPRGR
jgi:hypothetical protein